MNQENVTEQQTLPKHEQPAYEHKEYKLGQLKHQATPKYSEAEIARRERSLAKLGKHISSLNAVQNYNEAATVWETWWEKHAVAVTSKSYKGCEISEKLLGHVVSTYYHLKNIRKLEEVIKIMRQSSIMKHPAALNHLMQLYLEKRDSTRVEEIFCSFPKYGVSPNAVSYMKVLGGFMDMTNDEKVLKYCDAFLTSNELVTERLAAQMISYFGKREGLWKKAQEVYEITKQHSKLSVTVCTAMMETFRKAHRYVQAEEVLADMDQYGIEKNSHTYKVIMEVYAKLGKIKETLTIFSEIREKHIVIPTYSLLFLAGTLKDCGEEEAYREVQKMLKPPTSQEEVMRMIITAMKLHNFALAEKLAEQGNYELTEQLGTTLISLFTRIEKFDKAEEVWNRLQEKNLATKDLYDQHPLVSAVANLFLKQEKYEDVKRLILNIQQSGGSLTLHDQQLLLVAYCGSCDVENAEKLYKQLSEVNQLRGVHTFALLEMYCRLREDKKAEELFQWVEEKFPSPAQYTAYLKILLKTERLDQARLLCERVVTRQDFLPDPEVFLELIRFYRKERDLEKAEKTFEAMVNRNITPNKYVYTEMVSIYAEICNLTDFSPDNLLQLMCGKGFVPTQTLFLVIIGVQIRIGNRTKAKEFFQEMTQRGFPPNNFTYKLLQRNNKFQKSPSHARKFSATTE